MSLYIPHPAVIHIVYSSIKTHPVSCKLLVPPLILSPSPFLLSSVSPPPQNVWIDLNGVIVTALPAVCPSTSASQRLWKVWREQRERKTGKDWESERERGESSFEQQGMAALQRAKSSVRSQSQLQPVPLSLPLSICSRSLFLSFSHTVFFRQPIPCRTSHPQLAVYNFSLWIDPPPSLSSSQPGPLHPNLFLFSPGLAAVEGVGGGWCTGETKPPNPGLSFTQEVSHCVWGASWRCHMSWHSKSRGLRMWVIWSRGTKVCCLPMNGAFSHWHGEKRVNKHQRLGATLKCSAVFFSAPHLYKPVII